MFDTRLRGLKDRVIAPLSRAIAPHVSPLQVTGCGFLCGLLACVLSTTGSKYWSTALWLLNRALDCLDGAVARERQQQSDLGGFLDLLADFIIYALIPVSCTLSRDARQSVFNTDDVQGTGIIVSLLEASFFINNFVLFYAGAVLEKEKRAGDKKTAEELTSIAMRPALVEGFESGVFFTSMLILPAHVRILSLVMLVAVAIGTAQRVYWLLPVLARQQQRSHPSK